MCTLTIVPSAQGRIITINRDESPLRAASAPVIKETNGHRLWLAPEPVSGSSNLIVNIQSGRVAVLLNGAFVHHQHRPPYRISRGQVIIESFDFDNLHDMARQYDFSGIEPFTLVHIKNGRVEEMRWDGSEVHHRPINGDSPRIWSSAQLYRGEWQQIREQWFSELLALNLGPDASQIWKFHTSAGIEYPENGLVMNRMNLVKTVSVTQLEVSSAKLNVKLLDVLNNLEYREKFALSQPDN